MPETITEWKALADGLLTVQPCGQPGGARVVLLRDTAIAVIGFDYRSHRD